LILLCGLGRTEVMKSLAILILILPLHLTSILAADDFTRNSEDCIRYLEIAAAEVVRSRFEVFSQVEIKASNDFFCYRRSDKESMANAVLVVRTPEGNYFSIVHLHFMAEGRSAGQLRSVTFWDPEWTRFNQDSKWKERWCREVIRIYPKERETQGCASCPDISVPIEH